MSRKIDISKNVLENLYLDKKLSTYQIAKKFNCDPSVIQKRLKEYAIRIRYSKGRVNISKDKLENLYWDKNLSSYKIAKLLKIGRTTIYSKLISYGIKIRSKKIVNISKNKLKELYYDQKLSLSKIAKLNGCTPPAILGKMRIHNLDRRFKCEANTFYLKQKFKNDLIKKAYMIGFRLGDLNVKKDSKNSSVIKIKCSTTKLDQVNLIKKVYGSYGHFWCKKIRGVYSISFNLDKSFKFLLPKEDNIPFWILKKDKFFFSFFGGYADAEGNFGIYQDRARFRLGSYDKNILEQIKHKLDSKDINAKLNLEGKAIKFKRNQDFYRISVNEKKSILRLINLIRLHINHKKRYVDMNLCEKNILERNKKYGGEAKL